MSHIEYVQRCDRHITQAFHYLLTCQEGFPQGVSLIPTLPRARQLPRAHLGFVIELHFDRFAGHAKVVRTYRVKHELPFGVIVKRWGRTGL